MPDIEYISTCSAMMRSIVAECKCQSMPVVAYQNGEYTIQCAQCNISLQPTTRLITAIENWNDAMMASMPYGTVVQRMVHAHGVYTKLLSAKAQFVGDGEDE